MVPRVFQVSEKLDLEILGHLAEDLDGFVQRHIRTLEAEVLFDLVPHALLDGLKIFGCQRPGQVDVIKKAVFDDRPDTELRLGKHFLNTRGHNVGQRVTLRIEFFVFHKNSLRVSMLRSLLFEVESAGVARQRTVMSDDTMTRNHDRNAIVVIRHSYGSRRGWFAEFSGDLDRRCVFRRTESAAVHARRPFETPFPENPAGNRTAVRCPWKYSAICRMQIPFDCSSWTEPCGTWLPKRIETSPLSLEAKVSSPNGVLITAYRMENRVTYRKNENKTAIPTIVAIVQTNATNSVTRMNVGRLSE